MIHLSASGSPAASCCCGERVGHRSRLQVRFHNDGHFARRLRQRLANSVENAAQKKACALTASR